MIQLWSDGATFKFKLEKLVQSLSSASMRLEKALQSD